MNILEAIPANLVIFSGEDLVRHRDCCYSPVVTAPASASAKSVSRVWTPSWNIQSLGGVTVSLRFGDAKGWTGWKKKYHWQGRFGYTIPAPEQGRGEEVAGCLKVVTFPTRCQLRLSSPGPTFPMGVHSLSLSWYDKGSSSEYTEPLPDLCGYEIPLLAFAQLAENKRSSLYPRPRDGDVGRSLCFPTSLAMAANIPRGGWWGYADIMPYHVAQRSYDSTTDLYGVWSLNAAALIGLTGTECFVTSLPSMAYLEAQLLRDMPVPVSIGWEAGELQNASQLSAVGHMVVVIGFTEGGDVVVCDPNTQNREEVRRVFKRQEFFAAWQRRSCMAFLFQNRMKWHKALYE